MSGAVESGQIDIAWRILGPTEATTTISPGRVDRLHSQSPRIALPGFQRYQHEIGESG